MNKDQALDLSGEVCLVTGGATGLGFAIAQALVHCGAQVVICGRRQSELETATEALGPSAQWRVHDVTRLAEADALIGDIEATVGALGVLVNNAGKLLKKPSVEVTDDEFQGVLDVHLGAGFALSRAAASRMLPRKKGSILFIASMASLFGLPNVIAYTAAKSALTGLVRGLAVEWSPHGLRVNGIAPGWIDSEMMRGAMRGDPQRERKILERTPLGRFGEAEDVGWAAAYLSSPAAKFITGTCLVVDGGASVGF
jgi:gluconate 5-dehydrogenase